MRRTYKRTFKKKHNKKWISPIPRIIHFVWIGTAPLPYYFDTFLQGFRTLNPEFKIKVWRNKDITKKNFPKVWEYLKLSKKLHGERIKEYTEAYTMYKSDLKSPYTYNKFAQQTDLIRLELIYNNGGYYFDTTFSCLKPLYNLFNCKNKFVGSNEVPRFKDINFLSNSFFGATKGNPILKRLLNKKSLNKIDFRSANVAQETGPYYLRSGIKLSADYKIFPSNYFYPYIEEYSVGENPPFRKASKDMCLTKKKSKNSIKLKNKKGYLQLSCDKYPKAYAKKNWILGKSWLIENYYIKEASKTKQTGGVCMPCIGLSKPLLLGIAAKTLNIN